MKCVGFFLYLKDADGWKAIHYAVTTKSQEMVDLLLHYGADIDVKTSNGITPIWLMIRYNLHDMAEDFIQKGCTVTSSVKLKCIYQIACEHPQLPKELFDPEQQRANPREQARKAQRKISLLDFSLFMRAYKVSLLILDKVLENTDNGISLTCTQELLQNQLKTEEEMPEDNCEHIQLCQELKQKLSNSVV